MITEKKEIKRRHKTYQELEFTDDFMFKKVLCSNEKLCRSLIELLLGVKVKSIHYKDEEHNIAPSPEARGVRLDVYLDDEDNTVFDLEMQNQNRYDLPRRTRYYQSMIDLEHLEKGVLYEKLPDSYIVFICMFDPFDKGLHKYEFREICTQDTSIELGDGASKVYINARSKESDMPEDMRAFLDFLCGHETRSNLTREIAESVERAKAVKFWEAEYMQWTEIISLAEHDARNEGHAEGLAEGRAEGREEGRAEGLAEGRAEGREEGLAEGREEGREKGRAEALFESVDKLVAGGVMTAEKACEVLGVDIDKYHEYLKAK